MDQFSAATTTTLIGLSVILPGFIVAFAFVQKFATKRELKRVEIANAEALKALETRFETDLTKTEERLTSQIRDSRSNSDHSFGELKAGISGLSQNLQLFANETSRIVGVLEGKMSFMEKPSAPKPSDV
jgi:hypothetical protein